MLPGDRNLAARSIEGWSHLGQERPDIAVVVFLVQTAQNPESRWSDNGAAIDEHLQDARIPTPYRRLEGRDLYRGTAEQAGPNACRGIRVGATLEQAGNLSIVGRRYGFGERHHVWSPCPGTGVVPGKRPESHHGDDDPWERDPRAEKALPRTPSQ